jgi:hypothetical protein
MRMGFSSGLRQRESSSSPTWVVILNPMQTIHQRSVFSG